jgi:hypothetical protein
MRVSPTIWLVLGALLMLSAVTIPAAAQTSDSTNEFWPEFDFYINLNEKSRIFLMYTATKQQDLNAYADGQVGAYYDYWAGRGLRKRLIQSMDPSRSKAFLFRAGYLFARPKNGSSAATENMVTGEVTARAHLSTSLLLSDRSRIDLRWLNGDPAHRYRNRLKLEDTFDIGRFQLTPYAYAEVFYAFDERKWTRVRYAAGAEWNITKRIVLEGYYLRQNTWGSVPQFVNALGVAVQFYFR